MGENSIQYHRISEVILPEGSNLSGDQVAVILLRLVSRLAVLAMPQSSSVQYYCGHLKQPFTVEIHTDLFKTLYKL